MSQPSGFEVWILSIGNELLIGKTINTNLTLLGKKLTHLGYNVRRGLILSDIIEDIAWGFTLALNSTAKVIISTGGLGPTFDDKTVEGLAKALGKKLIIDNNVLSKLKEKYKRINLPLTPVREKMAKIPEGSIALDNPVGMAPGIYIKTHGKHIFVLPGVPREMKAIFEKHIENILKEIGPKIYFLEKMFTSIGVPESEIAPFTDKLVREHPTVYIKSHPLGRETRGPIIKFHITASSSSKTDGQRILNTIYNELKKRLIQLGAKIEE